MNTRKSTLLKFLECGLLVLLASNLQAQLLKKIQFTPAEGYTNGWAYGQPAKDYPNVWWNTSDYVGNSWTNADGSTFYDNVVTNVTPDGKSGYVLLCQAEPIERVSHTMVFYMPFANLATGQVTITWDWQFFNTNIIPADFDPTNNNYVTTSIHGTDAFTVGGTNFPAGYSLANNHSDMQLDFYDTSLAPPPPADPRSPGTGPSGTSALCTQSRINLTSDCRSPAGWGADGATGPYAVDYKQIHMKVIADIDNQQFQAYAQRDGEQVWLTTMSDTLYTTGWFPFRHSPVNGLNSMVVANNDGAYPDSVAFSNIRVVGSEQVAVPSLSIAGSGGNVTVTFTGWLEAADNVQGPYSTVAVTPAPYTTATTFAVPASDAKKFYRASM